MGCLNSKQQCKTQNCEYRYTIQMFCWTLRESRQLVEVFVEQEGIQEASRMLGKSNTTALVAEMINLRGVGERQPHPLRQSAVYNISHSVPMCVTESLAVAEYSLNSAVKLLNDLTCSQRISFKHVFTAANAFVWQC